MKHFLAAFKAMFPPLSPLVEGMEKDMAEMDAQFERDQAEFERKRDERRREWDEQIDDLLR